VASFMMQEMGIKAIHGVSSFLVSREEYKVARILEKHQNTMAALSAAQSHNQLTRNSIQIDQQALLTEANDQIVAMQDTEMARLSAAATGTSGNSVDAGLASLGRAKAQRDYSREQARQTAQIGIGDQRRQVELAKIYNQSTSVMPKPSVSNMLLGLGTSLYDTYRQHTPQT